MANLQDLDSAIQAVSGLISTLATEVDLLIAKVQAGGDFTNEVAALGATATAIQTAIDKAKAVTGQ